LIDMGIEPYLISSSVAAIMAQRLLRIICPKCKKHYKPKKEIISLLSKKENTPRIRGKLYKGTGCEDCLQTGYFGRTGIFELLTIDDDIREMIIKRSASNVIKEAAIEKGMTTLREDGLRKALSGETTLEEVCRVTQGTMRTTVGAAEHVGN